MWQHLREIINEATTESESSGMPHLDITADPSVSIRTVDREMRDDVPTYILENPSIVIRTNLSLEEDVPAPNDISKVAADVNEAFIYDEHEDDDDDHTNPTTWTSSYDEDEDNDEQWEDGGETLEDDTIIRERDAAQRRVIDLEEELGALISATQALARLVKKQPPPSPTVAIIDDDEVALDQLVTEWRLEDTGFVSLYSSCRTLQSNLALTQAEADAANEEIRAARSEVLVTKSNLATANKGLRQLWKENAMLKEERKALVRDVRRYVKHKDREARDEIDRTVAFIAHEQSFSSSLSFDRNNAGAIDDELSVSSSVSSNPPILPSSPSVDSDCDSSATLHIKALRKKLYHWATFCLVRSTT